ncbi:hypothetical protein IHE61_04220 [Streptomyces sp. GKU 257-1]|nr:hypothetical protein [Streptomyces sp. GKU 257-1]
MGRAQRPDRPSRRGGPGAAGRCRSAPAGHRGRAGAARRRRRGRRPCAPGRRPVGPRSRGTRRSRRAVSAPRFRPGADGPPDSPPHPRPGGRWPPAAGARTWRACPRPRANASSANWFCGRPRWRWGTKRPTPSTPDAGFQRLGLTSLGALELRNRLGARTGLRLPATMVFEHRTPRRLAAFLAGRLADAGAARAAAVARTGTADRPAAPEPAPEPAEGPAPDRRAAADGAGDRIAIVGVGVAGRYPLAETVGQLWENLARGRHCIREVPADRWDADAHHDPTGTWGSYSKWAGFLDDVDATRSTRFLPHLPGRRRGDGPPGAAVPADGRRRPGGRRVSGRPARGTGPRRGVRRGDEQRLRVAGR